MRVRIPSYVELSRNNHEYPSPLFVALRSSFCGIPFVRTLLLDVIIMMASVLRCILLAYLWLQF